MGIFPIENLRQAVETAKRMLTKEKIERQLVGHSSTTPFMNIKDNCNNKKVTYNTQDVIEDTIDRLTVIISQLTMKDGGLKRQFKPKIYEGRGRGQSRNFYNRHNYDQWGYQNRQRSNNGVRRISFSGRNLYGQNRGRSRYEQNYRNDYMRQYFRGNMRMYQDFGRQNSRGRYRGQSRNFYNRHNYDQWGYQNRQRSNSGVRRIPFSGRNLYGQNRGRSRYEQNYRND